MEAPFRGLAIAAATAWNRVKTAGGGSTLLEKLAGGMAQAATVLGQPLAGALASINQGVGRIAAPALLTGTLALTPVVADERSQPGMPLLGPEPPVLATGSAAAPEASRLLAETRGALRPGDTGTSHDSVGDLRTILDALLGKLDALADRPIDVSVTTLLDGRQVAQSVYRDIRERKIKNYETL